ncbi:MAG TPA: ribulose-phosphate 3-epimerase [Candidatus Paceibacterota bacterium]|nr:ribulose-phosphate 3-epimerase [Candidatus Paceibacterota bacterium]
MQKVVPAILTADPAELREGLKVLRNQTKWVQIDIMDGRFVPNTSINLFELGEAYQFFNLEIHLMVQNPEKYFEDCKAIGAKRVIFHAEATGNIAAVLEEMEKYPFQRAVAINPETPVSIIAPYTDKLDAVLIMSVHPGFQAQEFIPGVLSKIAEIRRLKEDIIVGLDGGINEKNIKGVFEAGADYAGVGSAVMKTEDPAQALTNLEQML